MVSPAVQPETFMLDSSACIHVLRGHAPFDSLPAREDSTLSSIVAAELWTGVEKSGNPVRLRQIDDLLVIYLVVDFDNNAARHYAEIRADLERLGKTIGPMDLLIAAHARSLGATLVTRNAKEFRRVKGLRILAMK